MISTPIMDVKLTSNGVVVGFWKARFVRSSDDLSGHWESPVWPVPENVERLWKANGYAKIVQMEVGNG